MAEFVEVGDADFVFEADVFFSAELVDGADVDEERAEGFGNVVFFEAVELTEHVGIIGRPFFEKRRDFFGVFANGRGERCYGALDGFVGAVEKGFPGKVVGSWRSVGFGVCHWLKRTPHVVPYNASYNSIHFSTLLWSRSHSKSVRGLASKLPLTAPRTGGRVVPVGPRTCQRWGSKWPSV